MITAAAGGNRCYLSLSNSNSCCFRLLSESFIPVLSLPPLPLGGTFVHGLSEGLNR